jgi:hypothetical protein
MSLKDTYNNIRNRQEASDVQKAIWEAEAALNDFAATINERRDSFIGGIKHGVADAEARTWLSDARRLTVGDLHPRNRGAFFDGIKSLHAYKKLFAIAQADDMCVDVLLRPDSKGYELIIAIDPEKTRADSRVGHWKVEPPLHTRHLVPPPRKKERQAC